MAFFNKLSSWLKNKYVLIGLLFLIWMIFLDQYRFLTQWKLMKKRNELRKEIEHYTKLIDSLKAQLRAVQEDSFYIEKYAREQYFFRKPNEIIIVLDTLNK